MASFKIEGFFFLFFGVRIWRSKKYQGAGSTGGHATKSRVHRPNAAHAARAQRQVSKRPNQSSSHEKLLNLRTQRHHEGGGGHWNQRQDRPKQSPFSLSLLLPGKTYCCSPLHTIPDLSYFRHQVGWKVKAFFLPSLNTLLQCAVLWYWLAPHFSRLLQP